jgi:hypothetical protein
MFLRHQALLRGKDEPTGSSSYIPLIPSRRTSLAIFEPMVQLSKSRFDLAHVRKRASLVPARAKASFRSHR